MIWFIFLCFVGVAIGLTLLMSYELRYKCTQLLQSLLPSGKKKIANAMQFAEHMHQAASPEKLQSHWHLQQWWILIAGFFLFASILVFAFTRPISSTRIEAEYLKETDPQVYALLNGEMLSPPPDVDETLIQDAIVEATRLEQAYQAQHTAIRVSTRHKLKCRSPILMAVWIHQWWIVNGIKLIHVINSVYSWSLKS